MATGRMTLGTRRRRRSTALLPLLSFALVLMAVVLFVIELIGFSQAGDRLPVDLAVAGVPVGGLTRGEAVAQWESAYAQPVILYYNDSPIVLEPTSVGFRTSRETMLAQALSASDREGGFWLRFFNHLTLQDFQNSINVPLSAEYQGNLLDQFLADIAVRYDRPPGEATYDLQSLQVFSGAGGYELDIPLAREMVDTALRSPDNRTVVLPVRSSESLSPGLASLQNLIVEYLDSVGFAYDGGSTIASVYIMDLQTGEEIALLGDVPFSAASTMKVAILIDYYRYLSFAPSQDEAWLMANSLLCSNNSSSNLLMQISGGNDIFAGIANVTNTAQYVGARNTFITAPFVLGTADQQLGSIAPPPTTPNPNYRTRSDPYNQTTAEDLGSLFTMIYDCAYFGSGLMAAYPNGEFTQNECRQMLELMSANDLLRLLQGGIPAGTRIAHKNGWTFTDMHGDAGIVFSPNGRHYVIAVMLWEDTDFLNFERAWPIIEELSRATWNYFNPETPLLARRTDLPPLAQDCVGNYLPPSPEQVDLNNINGWRENGG